MREILFRGKRKDNEEWIIGYYSYANDGHGTELYMVGEKVTGLRYPVIPETVGQYTGLTDKNRTKIFEGDIVKAECDLYHAENKKERVTHIGTVIYDKKFCQFGINVAGFSKCYVLNRWKGDYNEVIGNIHDNSELLKGGAE